MNTEALGGTVACWRKAEKRKSSYSCMRPTAVFSTAPSVWKPSGSRRHVSTTDTCSYAHIMWVYITECLLILFRL